MKPLKYILSTLGYTTQEQQVAYVTLMDFAGCFRVNEQEPLPTVLIDESRALALLEQDNPPFLLNQEKFNKTLAAVQDVTPLEQNFLAFINSTQEHMIRKTQERQQLEVDARLEEVRNPLTSYMRMLGHIDALSSSTPTPDVTLFFGAAEAGVRERIGGFEALIENNILKSKGVYLLGSQRPLWFNSEPMALTLVGERMKAINPECDVPQVFDKYKEELKAKTDILTNPVDRSNAIVEARKEVERHFVEELGLPAWPTESDMIEAVVRQRTQERPDLWNGIAITSVDTPNKPNGARADTLDTIHSFRNNHGMALAEQNNGNPLVVTAISSQPHIFYQQQQLLAGLSDKVSFQVEVVGPGVDPNRVKLAEVYDAMARAGYASQSRVRQALKMPLEAMQPESKLSGAEEITTHRPEIKVPEEKQGKGL